MERVELKVFAGKEVKKQGDLFGIFFEDLNHAADGGLYAELVRNRSFEFNSIDNQSYHGLTAWKVIERGRSVVNAHVDTVAPLNDKNNNYLRLEVNTPGTGGGIQNEGYGEGIPVEEGKAYNFSCYYRRLSTAVVTAIVRLEDVTGEKVYAEKRFPVEAKEWTQYECELVSNATDAAGRLSILFEEAVHIDFDMVSLFPQDTFMNRKNGLRKDIAELLQEMKPSFMRFPGGCLVHIGSLNSEDRNSIYRWKNTVGPVENRPPRKNSWNYNQTLGLGYFEYFQFCEDIGAEPLPVVPAGFDPHFLRSCPLDEMQEWIDEVLDLVEFANGSVDTKWGAVRAEMGHPESFHLKYLAIGNEEVGEDFFIRYEIMLKALKEKHPEIEVIGSAGPAAKGSEYDMGWDLAEKTETSYVDEHYYQSPEWFIANAERYMEYPQRKAKVFLGEYASHENAWKNALYEAVFMMGMEKAPEMALACYAPMLCHVDYTNWHANMIFYNNHQVYATPNYYVQKLFMRNQGEALIETDDNIVKKEQTYPTMEGDVVFTTNNAQVEISNVVITDKTNHITRNVDDFTLSQEAKLVECGKIEGQSYTISFDFEKKTCPLSKSLTGADCFMVCFARQDEQNEMRWIIDGWEHLTMLEGRIENYPTGLGMYTIDVEEKHVYNARIEVEGNHITTYIDGKKYCDHEAKNVIPETLYYSAVEDEDAVMVKVANVEAEDKEVVIQLENVTATEATLYIMEDFDLDEENSFDEPTKVSPVERTVPVNDGQIVYTMKPHSFGVFCISRK